MLEYAVNVFIFFIVLITFESDPENLHGKLNFLYVEFLHTNFVNTNNPNVASFCWIGRNTNKNFLLISTETCEYKIEMVEM